MNTSPTKIIILLFVVVIITGCATTANYKKVLNSWVGMHVDRLVSSWGPPHRSYDLSNGGKVLEYTYSRNSQVGGFTYTTPQTSYHTGSVSSYGNYGGYAHGNYSGTSTTYVQKQTPVYNIHSSCQTQFTTNSAGIIKEWKFQGNACRAKDPGTVANVNYNTYTKSHMLSSPKKIYNDKPAKAIGDIVRIYAGPVGLYKEPSEKSEQVQVLNQGQTLIVTDMNDEWIQVTPVVSSNIESENKVRGWVDKEWTNWSGP